MSLRITVYKILQLLHAVQINTARRSVILFTQRGSISRGDSHLPGCIHHPRAAETDMGSAEAAPRHHLNAVGTAARRHSGTRHARTRRSRFVRSAKLFGDQGGNLFRKRL